MAGYASTGARLAMCPDLAVTGTAARPPVLCLQYMKAASLMRASWLLKGRVGGAQSALCATPPPASYHVQEACAKGVPGRVHSCAARVISPTSSRASAARLNGAVRALAKARPLLCAAAAACNAHHYYDCLSLFFHLQLRVAALSSPRDTTVSLALYLPPRHALTGYACAPPANILRGW